jgi:hypothetical protein
LLNVRRVRATTILGAACGLISWAILSRGIGLDVAWSHSALIVLVNTLMGFTIGISSLRYHWMMHGALIGGIYGLVLAIFSGIQGLGFWWPLILGPVYGVVIGLCATVFLHANMDAW